MFAFRAIASGNRIANLFLFVCSKNDGSGHFSCWGLNPDQRIESPVPYPLRQFAHGFESQILRPKLSRDSNFLKSLQTKKSRNARHANTRSAKHQCETSVCLCVHFFAIVFQTSSTALFQGSNPPKPIPATSNPNHPTPTHATQAPSHLGRQQRLLATRGRRPRLLATWGKAAKAASRSRKAVQANPTLGTASARATRTWEVPESAMRV